MATVFTQLSQVYSALLDLIPHVEEPAMQYVMRSRVLPGRVAIYTDMPNSWNVRRISEYLRGRRAVKLSEATAIPDSVIKRVRLAEIEPLEWGDSYPVTERRIGTDPEDILAQVVTVLADSLGTRLEKQLFAQMLTGGSGVVGSGSADFSLTDPIGLQQEIGKQGWGGAQWYLAVHPFQTISVRETLVDLTKSGNPAFRDQFISSWSVGGFGNLVLIEAPLMPRNIVYKLDLGGGAEGDKFKLYMGEAADGDAAVTADITLAANVAGTISAIEAAIADLGGIYASGWEVTGSAANDLTLTPPTTVYVDAEDEVRIAEKSDGSLDHDFTNSAPVVLERSATAKAIMWTPNSTVLDIRKPFTMRAVLEEKSRYIDMFAHNVYGVGDWQGERRFHIHTTASSPLAVGT